MGIIILPFWFAALLVSIFAVVRTFQFYRDVEIDFIHLVSGVAISATIWIVLGKSYVSEGNVWALMPFFELPFYMVFVPFGFYLITSWIDNEHVKNVGRLVLVSVAFSGIFGVLFNDFCFGILDIWGVQKHH